MKRALMVAGIAVAMAACGGNSESPTRREEINGKFSLEVPASMTQTNELHEYAGLQVMNPREKIYLIAMEEAREEIALRGLAMTLERYADFVTRKTGEKLENMKRVYREPDTLGGLPAIRMQFTGNTTGTEGPIPITWCVAVVEGKDYFYQVIFWSSGPENQKEKQIKTAEGIFESFRAIKQ